MTDDLHRALARLYGDDALVALAVAEVPTAGIPAGGVAQVLALAALPLLGHFGALSLTATPGVDFARDDVAAERALGVLPNGLGALSYGQLPETRGVLRVDLDDAHAEALAGDVLVRETDDGTRVLLRARDGLPAAVRVWGRGRELVVVRAAEGVRVLAPPPPARDALAPLLREALLLTAWTDGAAAQPWLIEAATQRARGDSATDRLAAVGLLQRLWTPTDTAVRTRAILGALTPPGQRARAHLAALPGTALDAAAREVLRDADALRDTLDAPTASAAGTLALAHRRDDLESARAALALVDRGAALDARLRALDVHGRAGWSALPTDAALRDDPRLCCVRWAEPDAWWALFVDG